MNFCYRCAATLTNISDKVYKCANGHTVFESPIPTTGIFFITDKNEVLLSERGIEPHKGMLDSFGGFLDLEETIYEAAIRELKEELDLDPQEYEPLRYIGSANGHYPFEGEVQPIVSTFFWTRLTTDRPLIAQDDVAAVKSIPLADVDLTQLHDDDVRWAVKELQRLASENLL